jgi:hypothetical protein
VQTANVYQVVVHYKDAFLLASSYTNPVPFTPSERPALKILVSLVEGMLLSTFSPLLFGACFKKS